MISKGENVMKIWGLVSNVDDILEQYGKKALERPNEVYDLILIDYASIDIETKENLRVSVMGEEQELPDAFWSMTSNTDSYIIPQLLMNHGVESLINPEAEKTARSKVITYDILAKAGFKVPKSVVFFNHADKEKLVNTFGYPFVIKPDNGFGGEGVELIHNEKELDEYLDTLKYGVSYVAQEYISTSRGTDIRVVVLNNKVIYSMQRKAGDPNEFRSNVHQGGSVSEFEIDEETKKMCEDVSKLFDLPVVGLDLMIGEDGYVFAEVNSFPGVKPEIFSQIKEAVVGAYVRSKENN